MSNINWDNVVSAVATEEGLVVQERQGDGTLGAPQVLGEGIVINLPSKSFSIPPKRAHIGPPGPQAVLPPNQLPGPRLPSPGQGGGYHLSSTFQVQRLVNGKSLDSYSDSGSPPDVVQKAWSKSWFYGSPVSWQDLVSKGYSLQVCIVDTKAPQGQHFWFCYGNGATPLTPGYTPSKS